MRVAGDPTRNLLVALNNTQIEQEKALEQISSGKRISVPSDDPGGMAAWLGIRSAVNQDDEFLHSISSVTAVLQTADSTLNSVVTELERGVGLAVRGSTSSLSQTDREQIAGEVDGILEGVLELANSNFRGSYLFAGTDVLTKPFAADPSSSTGYVYNGNSGSAETPIGDGRTIQMNVAGDQIFMAQGTNVFQALSDVAETLRSGDPAAVGEAAKALRTAFDHVVSMRVFYGNAVSQLEKQTDALKSEQLQLATQENDIAGNDQAESITRFLNAQNARDAALAAGGKVSNLSLLDYLQ